MINCVCDKLLYFVQFDLMGQSVLAYTHEGDHDDLKDCFDQKKGGFDLLVSR